jgi:hypothetical protein
VSGGLCRARSPARSDADGAGARAPADVRRFGLLIHGAEAAGVHAAGRRGRAGQGPPTVSAGKLVLVDMSVAGGIDRVGALPIVGAIAHASGQPVGQAITAGSRNGRFAPGRGQPAGASACGPSPTARRRRRAPTAAAERAAAVRQPSRASLDARLRRRRPPARRDRPAQPADRRRRCGVLERARRGQRAAPCAAFAAGPTRPEGIPPSGRTEDASDLRLDRRWSKPQRLQRSTVKPARLCFSRVRRAGVTPAGDRRPTRDRSATAGMP